MVILFPAALAQNAGLVTVQADSTHTHIAIKKWLTNMSRIAVIFMVGAAPAVNSGMVGHQFSTYVIPTADIATNANNIGIGFDSISSSHITPPRINGGVLIV